MKIALGMIVRDFISAHPLIDFLDNAETYGHQIDRVIVVYSHSMSRSALFALEERTKVSLIELHNYRRAYGEFNKLGVSDKSVDALLYSELLSEHGLIPYGFNRNHVLMEALFEDIDLLIFVDSDVQPRVLRKNREGRLWFDDVDFVGSHARGIAQMCIRDRPYSLVLERASGKHNHSVQRKAGPTLLHVLCSVPASSSIF